MSSLSLSLADGLGMEIGVDRADLDVWLDGGKQRWARWKIRRLKRKRYVSMLNN